MLLPLATAKPFTWTLYVPASGANRSTRSLASVPLETPTRLPAGAEAEGAPSSSAVGSTVSIRARVVPAGTVSDVIALAAFAVGGWVRSPVATVESVDVPAVRPLTDGASGEVPSW